MSNSDESCYLCGSTEDLTDDHVPPENLFPTPKPSNLITVRCCRRCNNSFSKDDEAFRLWVSSSLFRSEAGDWIWEKKVLGSTLPRSPKLHANLREYVGTTQVSTPFGIVEMPTLTIPQERAINYLVRITKGLIRHFYPSCDYADVVFRVFQVQPTRTGAELVEDLIPKLKGDRRGERVFRFWRGFAEDVKDSGIWLYSFYDGAWFIVFVRPKGVPFPGDPAPQNPA